MRNEELAHENTLLPFAGSIGLRWTEQNGTIENLDRGTKV